MVSKCQNTEKLSVNFNANKVVAIYEHGSSVLICPKADLDVQNRTSHVVSFPMLFAYREKVVLCLKAFGLLFCVTFVRC